MAEPPDADETTESPVADPAAESPVPEVAPEWISLAVLVADDGGVGTVRPDSPGRMACMRHAIRVAGPRLGCRDRAETAGRIPPQPGPSRP